MWPSGLILKSKFSLLSNSLCFFALLVKRSFQLHPPTLSLFLLSYLIFNNCLLFTEIFYTILFLFHGCSSFHYFWGENNTFVEVLLPWPVSSVHENQHCMVLPQCTTHIPTAAVSTRYFSQIRCTKRTCKGSLKNDLRLCLGRHKVL